MRCIAGRCPDEIKDRTAGKTAVCGRSSEGKTAWIDSSLQKNIRQQALDSGLPQGSMTTDIGQQSAAAVCNASHS